MPNILPFLPDQSAFAPEAVRVMSEAFDEVCQGLGVNRDNKARETIAVRIIELAQRGQLDVSRLRDRVLREANGDSPGAAGRTRLAADGSRTRRRGAANANARRQRTPWDALFCVGRSEGTFVAPVDPERHLMNSGSSGGNTSLSVDRLHRPRRRRAADPSR